MNDKTKYSISRGITGVVVGAGASLLGVILLGAYTAAVGVAALQELGLFERPRGSR